MNSFTVVLLFLLLLDNRVYMWTKESTKCTQRTMHRSLEVTCTGIPVKDEWTKINKSTTHLLVTCANNGDNITLEHNQLQDFPKLAFFYIKNCPLFDLPEEYFRNLIHLGNVVLENLPLRSLQNNVFTNSSNVLEMTLNRLENLDKVYPRFMENQNKLTKLHIIRSNITADEIKPTLISVYITLTDLYWLQNRQQLIFARTYFRDFVFDNLILENNGIENTEFLTFVRAKYLSLKNNPISKLEKFKLPKFQTGLESLNLAFTDLRGVFPEKEGELILPTLRELIISNNAIEGLPNNIDAMMPRLKVLDVRNNRLSTLPSTLHHMLTKNLGKVLFAENMFHCNCEIQWLVIGHRLLANKLLCQTLATEKGTQPSTKNLMKIYNDSELICTLPKLRLELYDQFKENKYSMAVDNNGVKEYNVVLGRGQAFNWKCVGRSDPAPRLKWVLNGQTLKVTHPPSQRYETNTVITNLVVEQKNETQTFMCKGTNMVGDTMVKLTVVSDDISQIQPAKIISIERKCGQIYQFKYQIIYLMIIFLFICQN